MSKPVISVENLSKAYRIGLKEEIPDTLAGAVTGFLKSPFRNLRQLSRLDTFRHQADDEDIFWALKDVSFEVQEGEVLGVIGRNGAGKSTLLKILSRITEPTSGRAVIRGRVSSLLEVGTGFHPELSGRENVYLNGTILGMTKAEIDRKFDEIVDFSGVEKFLDTPIKRYSSGMKVRLAFAVAAHLEPEILIIDEVLAVGDAEFQKKCLGKMQDVARGGKTVLFVSHDMAAMRRLSTEIVVLQSGHIVIIAQPTTAIDHYLDATTTNFKTSVESRPRLQPQHGVGARLLSVQPMPDQPGGFRLDEPLKFTVSLRTTTTLSLARFGVTVSDLSASSVFSTFISTGTLPSPPSLLECRLSLSDHRLSPGTYSLSLSIGNGTEDDSRVEHDIVKDATPFTVLPFRTTSNGSLNWKPGYGTFIYPPTAGTCDIR